MKLMNFAKKLEKSRFYKITKDDKSFLDYYNGKTVTYFWHAHRHE